MIQQLFIFNRADVSSILDFYAEKKKNTASTDYQGPSISEYSSHNLKNIRMEFRHTRFYRKTKQLFLLSQHVRQNPKGHFFEDGHFMPIQLSNREHIDLIRNAAFIYDSSYKNMITYSILPENHMGDQISLHLLFIKSVLLNHYGFLRYYLNIFFFRQKRRKRRRKGRFQYKKVNIRIENGKRIREEKHPFLQKKENILVKRKAILKTNIHFANIFKNMKQGRVL